MNFTKKIFLLSTIILLSFNASAQISPGEMSKAHADLDGVSNCVKCHTSAKVTREKCLDCHKEIKANIDAKKGYHASKESMSKDCAVCHNEHHGRNFQLIRFDKRNFDHKKTGFELKGEHAKQECNACHKPAFIKDPNIKKKSSTYLGLNQNCLSCHDDYHQGKLSSNCSNCHNFNSFKNATGFDHSKTHFPLLGKHRSVECLKCHKTEIVNGKTVQKFTGLKYDNCTACHKDVHNNKFGQNCKECHTEESFFFHKGMKAFDHDKTNYKLLGKHKLVDCKECHKTTLTARLKYNKCTDCHKDYHKKEFEKNGISPDCNQCHNNNGFTTSTYTIEKHNASKFKLEGAHLATSCMACHKKQKDWTFIKMGKNCVDCHKNEHKGFIPEKFFPNENCTLCHNVSSWKTVSFDHNKTGFKLDGVHAKTACSACHYRKSESGIKTQKFEGTSKDCQSCHQDSHYGQFAVNGKTKCKTCHGTDDWHKSTFDHNTSRFKLDGKHKDVKCEECHKPVMDEKGRYIQYKYKDIACATCHK